ncbi:hypothetical protein Q4Q35_07765 [Flavivirga aquimarina]|uniref:Uncharacterized protein n=1 Tax=Flavivirga aquimarina TaxID=2027862 RepID=A0ABT8W9F5_9FLAO|nr:hypothetical protein [Flavivirga aquimarina]MDO5969701.1 hypothetical protein [Flavivirga aquimarina]
MNYITIYKIPAVVYLERRRKAGIRKSITFEYKSHQILNSIPAYKTELLESETRKIQYLFESKGHKSIIKAIEYTPVAKRKGKVIYNLGFGDYNEDNGNIFDYSNSNNGDMRKVFSTVLNTIPKFFKENEDAAIWVQGSDSKDDFKKLCESNCKKNCETVCKNFNRRIKTYRYYLDRNLDKLSKTYMFFGLTNENTSSLSQYTSENEYIGILVFKKK